MPALDLSALSPEVTLLGTTIVAGPRSVLTSTPVTGFSDVASATVVVRVERVDNSNGEALSVTVQGSEDGDSWSTVAGPYSFTRDGTESLVVDDPADRLRVAWSASAGVREAAIGSVTARLGVVDAPGGGGGGLTPQTGAGSPGPADLNVTPDAVSSLFLDTTNGALFIAVGATSNDWVALGGAIAGHASTPYNGVWGSTSGGETRVAGVTVALTDEQVDVGFGNKLVWQLPGNDGTQFMLVQLGNAGQFTHFWGSDGTYTAPNGIIFPTSDPLVAGAWWDNAGTLTKSSGPPP